MTDDAGEGGDAEDLAWETTDSTVDYTCPGFDVREDRVTLPDGTETAYHYVDEPAAVVVLPFLAPDAAAATDASGGDVVVIEEWRQAVGRVNRGLPAGSVESDEPDLEAAAARELREETGHEAGAFTHLATVEPSNGIANSVHHHFVAHGCTPTASQDLDEDESIRVGTTPYEDLLGAVLDGEIRDGRTSQAVLRYEAER